MSKNKGGVISVKQFLVRFAIGLTAAVPILLLVAAGAPAQTQQAVIQIVVTTTDLIAPEPTPTPTPVVVAEPSPFVPTVVPTVAPTVAPPPPEPTAFPVNPPQLVVSTPGAVPVEVQVPQTQVFIQIVSVNGITFDVRADSKTAPGTISSYGGYGDPHTGGMGGPGPLTVVYQANFQGGFSGVTPNFIWDTGVKSQQITVTYTAGTYRASVKASEIYQGVTYQIGSANSVLITVT